MVGERGTSIHTCPNSKRKRIITEKEKGSYNIVEGIFKLLDEKFKP